MTTMIDIPSPDFHESTPESASARVGMTLADYLKRIAAGESFEIVAGRVISMRPSVSGHIRIIKRVFLLLNAYAEQNHLGEVFSDMTYTSKPANDPAWITGSMTPDVAFISQSRLSEQPNTPESAKEPFSVVPDLTVEVLLPNDNYPLALVKAAQYLIDGVRVIWLINFERKIVTVCYADRAPQSVSGDQLLSADPALPGWSMPVAGLFSN